MVERIWSSPTPHRFRISRDYVLSASSLESSRVFLSSSSSSSLENVLINLLFGKMRVQDFHNFFEIRRLRRIERRFAVIRFAVEIRSAIRDEQLDQFSVAIGGSNMQGRATAEVLQVDIETLPLQQMLHDQWLIAPSRVVESGMALVIAGINGNLSSANELMGKLVHVVD